MTTPQEPGWYAAPDPAHAGQERYWDGTDWLPSWRPAPKSRGDWWIVIGGVVAVAVILGLGATAIFSDHSSDPPRHPFSLPTHSPTSTGTPDIVTSGPKYVFEDNGANVNARMFGKAWPLTIRTGRINCIPITAGGTKLTMVVFTADNGTRYAVNGTARSRIAEMGFKDVLSIAADDPSSPGTKKSVGPIIDVCAPVMDR